MIEGLRHRLTIQQPTVTTNSYGEPITTWGALATVWGSIRPLSGREATNTGADQVQASVQHDVRIRYRGDITPRMRIVCGARTFDIETVDDPDGRRAMLRLLCREVL